MNAVNAARREHQGRARRILDFVAKEWTVLILAVAIVVANGLVSHGVGSIV